MNSRFFDNFFNGGGESSSNRSLKKYLDLVKKMDNIFKDNTEITTADINDVIKYDDTENVTNMEYIFSGCTALTEIPNLNFSNVIKLNSAFSNCSGLTNVTLYAPKANNNTTGLFSCCDNLKEAYVHVPEIGMNMFSSCTNLETLHIYGCGSNIGEGTYWLDNTPALVNLVITNITRNLKVYDANRNRGKNLSKESLIGLVRELITYVPDGFGTYTQTLTMGSTHLDKIKNKYVRLIEVTDEMREQDPRIDEKKPFELCEYNDEGAMTLLEYASLKRWTLQ